MSLMLRTRVRASGPKQAQAPVLNRCADALHGADRGCQPRLPADRLPGSARPAGPAADGAVNSGTATVTSPPAPGTCRLVARIRSAAVSCSPRGAKDGLSVVTANSLPPQGAERNSHNLQRFTVPAPNRTRAGRSSFRPWFSPHSPGPKMPKALSNEGESPYPPAPAPQRRRRRPPLVPDNAAVARDPAGHQLLPSGSQGPGSTAGSMTPGPGTARHGPWLQPAACMLAELPFSWCGCAPRARRRSHRR
jgi:hypothetical protein